MNYLSTFDTVFGPHYFSQQYIKGMVQTNLSWRRQLVKFILIDPKKVELSSYNLLKDYHLITTSNLDENVITKTENSIK